MTNIEDLKAALAKATPLPWRRCSANSNNCPCGLVWSETADCCLLQVLKDNGADGQEGFGGTNADADLATAAVNALPELLAELEQLRASREEFARSVVARVCQDVLNRNVKNLDLTAIIKDLSQKVVPGST